MEYVTLNNGVKMPMIGFGVFQVNDQKQCQQAVEDAIEVGYRSIDTAASYMNEEAVGAAVRNCGVKREELFVTTKLWVQDHEYDDTLRAFDTSMAKLGLDTNPTATTMPLGVPWNDFIKRDASVPSA